MTPTPASAALNNDQDVVHVKSLLKISGWTAETTERLIRGGRDPDCVDSPAVLPHSASASLASSLRWWDVVDNVMMSPAVAKESQPTNDGASATTAASSNFCDDLYRELQESGLLQSLQPAKTVGERNHPPSILLEMLGEEARTPVRSGTSGTIRGDKSLFVAREFRQQANFAIKHPHLSHLIAAVTETVRSAFDNQSNCNDDNDNENRPNFQFDYDQTSVQVAMYPGDGVSGYVRHCDRGQDFCRQEDGTSATSTIWSNPPLSSTTTPQRLLTCIYYLTPHDWNPEQDGGALRVFHSHQGKTTDICPKRDRMVVFRADKIEHQVLPSLRRPRTAITLWFYGTIRQPSLTMTCSSAPRLLPPPLTIQDSSSTSIATTATIFVSIASYRDSELRPTLDALFGNANNPQRISVGVVLQLDPKHSYDQKVQASLEEMPYASHLRILRLDARDAMGPCYARGLCQTLWRDEGYVLQIDSHMRFRQNWDSYLVETHTKLESTQQSQGVILTTYPAGYTLPHNITHMETSGTYLVPWKFDDHGMLRQRGRLLMEKTAGGNTVLSGPRAHRHYLYAGGFNFGTAQACIHDVPYDTMGLSNLFFGEELSMSIRFYTHGYDMYAPIESVVYHLWSRGHRPPPTALRFSKEEEAKRDKQKEASRDKVNRQLLGDKAELGIPCGLGTVRKVADFEAALGIDFRQQKFLRDNVACGTLEESDFVDAMIGDDNEVGTSPEMAPKLKSKVAELDPKARALIGFFLNCVHCAP